VVGLGLQVHGGGAGLACRSSSGIGVAEERRSRLQRGHGPSAGMVLSQAKAFTDARR
jgi:hypothetical protein